MEPDWSRVSEAYDEAMKSRDARKGLTRAQIAQRASGASSTSATAKLETLNKVSFGMNQVDLLDEVIYAVTRINFECSNEHVGNVVVNLYGMRIQPFPVLFKPRNYILNGVWSYLLHKIVVKRRLLTFWWYTDRQEMWNRPTYTTDDLLTAEQMGHDVPKVQIDNDVMWVGFVEGVEQWQ